MKQPMEKFILSVKKSCDSGQIDLGKIDGYLTEYSQLISDYYYVGGNVKQTFLNINKLKLNLIWLHKQQCPDRHSQFHFFLELLVNYIDIELQSLKEHPETENQTIDIKGSDSVKMEWTAGKRSLIELICALNEAKCINQGNSSLQSVVVLFERVFDIKLDNYHSELNRMADRKPQDTSKQRAYFIGDLVHLFNAKMENN